MLQCDYIHSEFVRTRGLYFLKTLKDHTGIDVVRKHLTEVIDEFRSEYGWFKEIYELLPMEAMTPQQKDLILQVLDAKVKSKDIQINELNPYFHDELEIFCLKLLDA